MAVSCKWRCCFRLLRWSIFGLGLVGLGIYLASLPPRPRFSVPPPGFEEVVINFLSPDGTIFVTGPKFLPAGLEEWPIQIWETSSGRLKETLFPGDYFLSPNYRYLAWTSGDNKKAYLVDLQTLKQKKLNLKNNIGLFFQFSPRETFLLMANRNGLQGGNLVEIKTGKVVETLKEGYFVCFPTEDVIVYEMPDKDFNSWEIKFLDTKNRKVVQTVKNVQTVKLKGKRCFNGGILAAYTADGLVFVELENLKIHKVGPPTRQDFIMILSPNGRTLVALLEDGSLEFWDAPGGKLRRGDLGMVKGWEWKDVFNDNVLDGICAFSPDSSLLALACKTPAGTKLTLWDVASGTLLWMINHGDNDCTLRFTPNSRFLIPGNENQETQEILEARTGKVCRRITGYGGDDFSVDSLSFGYSGKSNFLTIVENVDADPGFLEKWLGRWWPWPTKTNRKVIRILDLAAGGEETARLETDILDSAKLSMDGGTLVTTHKEGGQLFLRGWDIPVMRPWPRIIGIPLGIGVMAVVLSWWRNRRRMRS